MNFLLLAILVPLLGALGLSAFGRSRFGSVANSFVSIAGFILTLAVWRSGQVGPLYALFGALSGFVGLMGALADLLLVRANPVGVSARGRRYDYTIFQIVLGLSLLGLYADNIGLLWLALVGETITMALGMSLRRTPEALEAAWDYMLLNGVGLGLALFGTLLVYLAAGPSQGALFSGLGFTSLSAPDLHFNKTWLSLGFVLIVFGYGAKAGLLPLRAWMSDSYAQGPVKQVCFLQGLSSNVALLVILRFGHIVHVNSGSILPTDLLLFIAIISLLFSAITISRQRNVGRFFGFLALQQSAITLFAFGIGGSLAIFAGLLQMLLQTLLKSGLSILLASAFEGGKSSESFAALRCLLTRHQGTYGVLGVAIFLMSGLPPSGLFVSEFMIIQQTIRYNPWLCLPLSIGLFVGALTALRRAGGLVLRRSSLKNVERLNGSSLATLAVFSLVLFTLLAFFMPLPLMHILNQAAWALQ